MIQALGDVRVELNKQIWQVSLLTVSYCSLSSPSRLRQLKIRKSWKKKFLEKNVSTSYFDAKIILIK